MRTKAEAFQDWLRKPVYLDQGDSVVVSRAQSFRIFMKEALFPFLTGNGYVFRNPLEIPQELANWIYRGVDRRIPDHRNHPYDRDAYDYRLDSEKWEGFWDTWGHFADFAENGDLQSQLHEFIWARLDLEYSPASAEVDEMLDWEESENQNQKEDSGFQNETSFVKDKHSLY